MIGADVSVISFLRKSRDGGLVLIACNFTPVPREAYRIGVPRRGGAGASGSNSDAGDYGGSGLGNLGALDAEAIAVHGQPHSLSLRLPPLAVVMLTPPQE